MLTFDPGFLRIRSLSADIGCGDEAGALAQAERLTASGGRDRLAAADIFAAVSRRGRAMAA